MTSAVNSHTEQKPIITLSVRKKNVRVWKRSCVSQEGKQKYLDLPGRGEGKKRLFFLYRVYLLSVLVNILILLTKVASLRD